METPIYYMWRVWYRSIDYLGDIIRGRRLRWFIQRRRRGFDDRELWGLDFTIAKFILPRLKAFNDFNKMSISPCFFDDPEECEHDDADWELARKNQKNAYDKMELAFFYFLDEGDNLDTGIDHKKYPDFQEAHDNIDKEKWNLYRKEMDRRNACIDEGLNLFAKYFGTLWD